MHLFPKVRAETQRLLNGYIQKPQILERIDEYIVPPALGQMRGRSARWLWRTKPC